MQPEHLALVQWSCHEWVDAIWEGVSSLSQLLIQQPCSVGREVIT